MSKVLMKSFCVQTLGVEEKLLLSDLMEIFAVCDETKGVSACRTRILCRHLCSDTLRLQEVELQPVRNSSWKTSMVCGLIRGNTRHHRVIFMNALELV